MDYEAFLIEKKIDGKSFQKNEPEMYAKWNDEYSAMHHKSFEARKLFLINKIRRKYKLEKSEMDNASKKSATARPIIKPKIKR